MAAGKDGQLFRNTLSGMKFFPEAKRTRYLNIVDPKIQTTSLVRLGSGLKGGLNGENTGQA